MALPGKHIKELYNKLKRPEARILAQLRTGMVRLNSYLNRIGATDSDMCPCGQSVETIKHFLFRCTMWTQQRTALYQQTATRRGNLSHYLGGKARTDAESWAPDMAAVRATITFATATGRLSGECV